MKIKELTPAITAKYLAEKLNDKLQNYIGDVCLFWDETEHYYGCMGGNDEGTLALVREIKAVAMGGHVEVELKTCCQEFTCDIDNFYINWCPEEFCINDEMNFAPDESGHFTDLYLEPMFEFFELCEIDQFSFHEEISEWLKDLITENFMGKRCIIEDDRDEEDDSIMYDCFDDDYDDDYGDEDYDSEEDDDDEEDDVEDGNDDPSEIIESLYFEPINEESLIPLVCINDRAIPYQHLRITLCEQN